ncbi:sporulation protein YqfC [Alkalibaculum sp. M08DMB]|uniref:Sporulation protein YqfC n=1 Tax=Alkalibaculum sporogenes TaxID=2655001 RepID=A0A6A7KC25_9FIRM|nr:sporulation protein YqfC [Alkalibaculum sporogenes]MPW27080.1 sporulation protein YqfC [Alkalibaculum sporogenes]
MGKKDKIEEIKENISDIFELPKEITLNLPKITIIGNVQVRIENHKGIIEYNDDKIRINSKVGIMIVTGENLLIRNIIKEEVVIEGNIINVTIDE